MYDTISKESNFDPQINYDDYDDNGYYPDDEFIEDDWNDDDYDEQGNPY